MVNITQNQHNNNTDANNQFGAVDDLPWSLHNLSDLPYWKYLIRIEVKQYEKKRFLKNSQNQQQIHISDSISSMQCSWKQYMLGSNQEKETSQHWHVNTGAANNQFVATNEPHWIPRQKSPLNSKVLMILTKIFFCL